MRTYIRHVTFDCADPHTLASFWARALEGRMDPQARPGDEGVLVQMPQGPGLLFLRVPEGKTVKNRVHLDLGAAVRRDEDVERLTGIGATRLADFRTEDGYGFVLLADPEGNEFCVERSDQEQEAMGPRQS